MLPPIKALCVRQPWAELIRRGIKTIEVRTWGTSHRGPLCICSSRRPRIDGLPGGVTVCIVELLDCRPMTRADYQAAGVEGHREGEMAWVLRKVVPLSPLPVIGQLGLFDIELPTQQASLF